MKMRCKGVVELKELQTSVLCSDLGGNGGNVCQHLRKWLYNVMVAVMVIHSMETSMEESPDWTEYFILSVSISRYSSCRACSMANSTGIIF